jgi:hypothetical protein
MLMKEPRKLVVAEPETKWFDLSPQVRFDWRSAVSPPTLSCSRSTLSPTHAFCLAGAE